MYVTTGCKLQDIDQTVTINNAMPGVATTATALTLMASTWMDWWQGLNTHVT